LALRSKLHSPPFSLSGWPGQLLFPFSRMAFPVATAALFSCASEFALAAFPCSFDSTCGTLLLFKGGRPDLFSIHLYGFFSPSPASIDVLSGLVSLCFVPLMRSRLAPFFCCSMGPIPCVPCVMCFGYVPVALLFSLFLERGPVERGPFLNPSLLSFRF